MSNTIGVTVLFTDLVGSTALSTSVGPTGAEQLRQTHFGLLRDAIDAHDGREVKNLGDGIMAVFPGASAALGAAVAMQQAVERHNRGAEGPELGIRIGVATGDCTEEDGDYFGEPVVQAARLCAAAAGGQVLATAVVGLLVPRDAHELRPVGDLELKGLPEPVPALEVRWVPTTSASPSPVPLPPRLTVQTDLVPMVGRSDELGTLVDALKAAEAGERRVALITGEAGLGKTTLTAAFADRAAELGTVVLYGRCDEELAVPYLPWVESLVHLVEHLEPAALGELPEDVTGPLARLIPALRTRLDGAPSTPGSSGPVDQYALFRAITALLARVALDETLVVVLDDLHWADRDSLALLRHVTVTLPSARLLLVGTYRETDLAAGDALTETSARLHREAGVQRINLTGLSDREVVELLEAAAGHGLDEDGVSLAHALRADTAGNPYFVTEVVRHLAETGALSHHDGRWHLSRDLHEIELPQSIRDVVGQRIRRLAPEARAVLTAGAVAGREFDTAVVAGAAELGEDEVLDVLEEAMAAGLVAEVAGAVDRFTFTHALVQHTLYSELTESRRARMHRRVATAIEELVGTDTAQRAGELAKHWFAAVRPAELDRAIAYAVEAGDQALATAAPDEAVRWFARALESADSHDRELRCEIQVRLGDAERQAGDGSYRERLLEAANLARQIDRGDLLIASALANYRGFHSNSGDIDHQRVEVLEAALARPEAQGADRARLLATLAGELTYTDDERRFAMAREAEELGESAGDPVALLDALERVGSSINVPEMLQERQRRAARVMDLTAARTDPLRRFLALELQTDVHLATANMAEARRCSAERRALADQLGQPTFVWLATHGAALLDVVEGDVEAAQAGTDAAFEVGLETGQPDVMVYFSGMVMQIHLHRGQYAGIISVARERLADNPGFSVLSAVLVHFLAQAGEHEEAAALLADLAADGFDFHRDLTWLACTVLCAEAAVILGELDTADLLHDRLEPYVEQVVSTRAYCLGPVAQYLGIARAARGDRDAAEAHFRAALELSDGLRSPFNRARALLGLAEVLGPTDPSAAAPLLAEVVALSERYQMDALAGRARQLLS